MKVGFLVDKISYGGGERILNFLMQELSLNGHTIYIFSWNKEWKCQERFGFKVITISEIKIGILNKISGIFSFKKELKENKPDCLIIFSLSLAEFGLFSGLLNSIPVILSERVDPKNHPKRKIHAYIKNLLFYLSSGVVFQTENAKIHYSKIVQKKGTIIPNPVLSAESLVLKTEKYCKEIVAIGRLSQEKNYTMLLKAFSKIKNDEYVLKIYGDGSLKEELDTLIRNLKIGHRCFLMGHSDNVPEKICKSDIFVLCSDHEGMPNALIESMSIGLACISTDFNSGGARSLIENGKNGLLIPVNDEKALTNAMDFLICNEELKLSIKKEALLIRNKLNKDLIIDQWINFLLSKISH